MARVYGYRMAAGEADQLNVWFLFRSAIALRAPVRVSYFKRKKDDQHRPTVDKYGNPVYVKITRVVEPYQLEQQGDGHYIARVVDRAPEGVDSSPEYRTIRLDRVAVRYNDGTPVMTVMRTYGFLCPTLLDGDELHPTKGGLGRKPKEGVLVRP